MSGPHSGRLTTVGYEGRTAEELVELLVAEGVDVLADVRLTPLSRKPGLSKRRLAESLGAAGIDYLHLPALGNPKDNREHFRTGDVVAGIARFRTVMEMPSAADALDRLGELARRRDVALLCFELEHARCHRQVVSDELVRRDPTLAPARLL
jgi:uncharacterized protein (DUF488 family)